MMMSLHTNYNAMHTYRYLQSNSKAMGKSVEKLSSGYRINSGEDGPADLIISEKLRAQIEGLERAIRNTNETKNLLSITEGALGEVQSILQNMKKLAVGAANSGIINSDQIAADQAQMDAALQAIDRILGTTSYAGRKLLDNMNLGGAQNSSSGNELQPGNVVATPDSVAGNYKNNLIDAGTVQPANATPQVDENGKLVEGDKTFSILGKDPEADPLASFSFAEGSDLADVIAALKGYAIPDEEKVELADDYAAPRVRNGDDINAIGLDMAALTHLQGLSDEDAGAFLADYMQNFSPASQLTAEKLDDEGMPLKLGKQQQELFDLSNQLMGMTSGGIGGVEVTKQFSPDGLVETRTLYLADLFGGGAASLGNDPVAAMKIINQAIKDIASTRAAIGSVQANRLQHEEDAMRAELENLTKSESYIRDTDFAREMVEYTRTQLIGQVGTQMLAAANQHGENILNLLA